PKGAPAWQATFADLMNLLLCFFVLLYAFSSTDVDKFEAIAASMSKAFSIFDPGGESAGEGDAVGNGVSQLSNISEMVTSMGKNSTGNADNNDYNEEGKGEETFEAASFSKEDLSDGEEENQAPGSSTSGSGAESAAASTADSAQDSSEASKEISDEQAKEKLEESGLKESEKLAELIEESVYEEDLSKQIDIDFTSQYVSLTMNGSLLFDSGSATIKDNAKVTLDKVGKILETYAGSTIEIEGHTDNVPISNSQFRNNDELSDARALSVFSYFRDNSELDPAMIKHTGRGAYVPIADNGTPEGRQLNRRVEIRIYNRLSDVS
ncbi:MAG: flagellar motor protein MotB, partial [Lachnospiraceae bacterium]|nr:flagellar motor protein MotB [Lachnospiraceae bacterium]